MKGTMKWLLVAALASAPAVPLEGQAPLRRGGSGPLSVDRAAERALRLADELGLSEDQRTELRGVRSEALTALETLEQETLALRQELRVRRRQEGVGERTPEEMQAFRQEQRSRMEELRARQRELTSPLLERYEGILSAEQRLELRELQRDRRARAHRGARHRGRMIRARAELRNRPGRGGGPGGGGERPGRWRGGR